jgi:hypothetical protein
MATKKRSGWISTLLDLVLLGTNVFGFMENLTALVKFEARLAGKSLISLVILALLMAMLFLSTWVCLLALLCIYLISLHWSWIAALSILLLMNFVFLLIIALMLCKKQRMLFFPLTREKCARLKK